MKFNDLPKYKKLAMYMQLKECIHDQFFDITDQHDIANLEKLGIVFSINKDINSLQKPHLEYLQKREISSLLQYLRKRGYAETNGNGIWSLTNDGGCICEDGWDCIDEDDNDFGYSFWPEDYQSDKQPSAPAQTSNLSDKVQELEDSLNEKLRLIGERDELIARLHKRISVLEAEKAELNVRLQRSNYRVLKYHNEEYAELIDRAANLMTDVIRLFR